jgi:hypothetical protein
MIEEGTEERIAAGNKEVYVNKMTMCKLLTRRSKMRIYRSLIRPVVKYGCQPWALKDINEEQLRVFEREVMSKIKNL